MKRIIIAVAVLSMAVAANAATVTWSTTQIYAPGTTTLTAGYIGYLFDEATVASTVIEAAITGGTFGTYAGSALSTGSSNTSGVITKANLGSYGATATTSNPEIREFYTVLFDAATYNAATKYILTSDSTVTFTSPTGSKSAAFVNVGTTYSWESTSAVPEPTSGLLLLLGMAGLALKRKNA